MTVVDGLEYRYDPVAGIDLGFGLTAPSPAPSPFRIEAVVQEPVTPPIRVVTDLWARTDEGVARIETLAPSERFGSACGDVEAEAGSDMAGIFGQQTRSFCDPVPSLLADTGQWTKSVFP